MPNRICHITENGIEKKFCSKCKTYLPLSYFSVRSRNWDGLYEVCKACKAEIDTKYREANTHKIVARQSVWAKENSDKVSAANSRWYSKNKDKVAVYREEWRKKNPDKVKFYRDRYYEAVKHDEKYRLCNAMRRGVHRSLTSSVSGKSSKQWSEWFLIVGYTVEDLKAHLEKQFEPWMSWANYGVGWQIDHKIPVTAFAFDNHNHSDFQRCWSLSNLRPLSTYENKSKSNKLDKPFQPNLF